MLEKNSRRYAMTSGKFMKQLRHTPLNTTASLSGTTGPYKEAHSHFNMTQISPTSSGFRLHTLSISSRTASCTVGSGCHLMKPFGGASQKWIGYIPMDASAGPLFPRQYDEKANINVGAYMLISIYAQGQSKYIFRFSLILFFYHIPFTVRIL